MSVCGTTTDMGVVRDDPGLLEKAFHDAALKESAVPLPVLDKLLE